MQDDNALAPEAAASVPESNTPEIKPVVPAAEGSQPSAESTPDSGEAPKAETEEEVAQKLKRARSNERYDRLKAESKHHQAEAIVHRNEVAKLRAELEKLRSSTPDEFDPNAHAHQLKQVVKGERLEQKIEEADAAAEKATRARQEAFIAKVDAARDRMPDFDQVFPNTPISEVAAELIADSDKAAEIAYWLGKNPKDAARIYDLPPHLQGAEIARIEGRLSTVSTRKTSNAPTPPPVLNGQSAPGAKDPSSMSMPEFVKWRAAQEKARA
jgi:hypothetical protein